MKAKNSSKNRENSISFYSGLSSDEKNVFRKCVGLIPPNKELLTYDDLIKFEKAKELLEPINKKYGIGLGNILEIVRDQILIPASIFNKKLTILESSVKYLREKSELNLKSISEVLNRNERNLWHTYDKATKKYPRKFKEPEDFEIWIPTLIFCNEILSPLETIVKYLKEEQSLNYSEIASLLARDSRTIWTVYNRSKKKNVK